MDDIKSLNKGVYLFIMIMIILSIILIVRCTTYRTNGIKVAVNENWSWYYNEEEVDYKSYNLTDYVLLFDSTNKRVIMSDAPNDNYIPGPVVVPLFY